MKAILIATLWISLLVCFTSSIHAQGGGNSPISAPISFIRQDNSAIPITGDDACHMVSKFQTDTNLPSIATFEGPTGSPSDLDTFRVQVAGTNVGSNNFVRLRVLRGTTEIYNRDHTLVSGSIGGTTVWRTRLHFRLVSNAFDAHYSVVQCCRVELGDIVRATLNGNGVSVELQVGRPFAENGLKAIRTADIRFTTLNGLTTNPAGTIARICENYAQVAIRANLANSQTVTPVSNVILIHGHATARGDLVVNIRTAAKPDGISITSGFQASDSPIEIALDLRDKIIEAGITATAAYNNGPDEAFVVVGKGENAVFEYLDSNHASVIISELALNYDDSVTSNEVCALSLNFRDTANEEAIEMFAVGDVLITGNTAAAGGDTIGGLWPGWKNVAVIPAGRAVATPVIGPFTAGHEFGHVILDDTSNATHSGVTNNIMFQTTTAVDAYSATKRLNDTARDQNAVARSKSGPNTTPPHLQKK